MIRAKVEFKLEDFWIGVFWKHSRSFCGVPGFSIKRCLDVWICLVPCFPLHIVRETLHSDPNKFYEDDYERANRL